MVIVQIATPRLSAWRTSAASRLSRFLRWSFPAGAPTLALTAGERSTQGVLRLRTIWHETKLMKYVTSIVFLLGAALLGLLAGGVVVPYVAVYLVFDLLHRDPVNTADGAMVARYLPTLQVALAALGAVLGVSLSLRRMTRTARSSLRRNCAKCGYDLTGNLSGRCPECGTDTATAHDSDCRGTDQ